MEGLGGRRRPRAQRVLRPDVATWEVAHGGGWDGGAPALRLAPQRAKVEIPWPFMLVLDFLGTVFAGVRWVAVTAFFYPFTVAGVLLAGLVVARQAFVPAGVTAAVLVVAVLVVAWRWPAWFTRYLVWPVRRYRRRRRLARRWSVLARFCGLVVVDHDHASGQRTAFTPRLSRLRWEGPAKAVLSGRVRIVDGQVVGSLTEQAEKLAAAADATWCRVEATGPKTATVRFLYGDPLADPIRHLPGPVTVQDGRVVDRVDLDAVPVGLTETGEVWSLKLTGATHTLIAGTTGAGKSSLVWSMLHGIAPAIASGRVQAWGIDGKRGIELGCARMLFTRYATTAHDAADLLEAAVTAVEARADAMAGKSRQHVATPDSPHVVILVDEVARLTAYTADRKLKDRVVAALSTLTTQGRAVGFWVLGTVQDPRADVTSIRHLFPVRIAMRLDSESETGMVLGEAAVEIGAACHEIAEHQAGVAFVKIDGRREPVRVRAAYLSDDDVRQLGEDYPAPAMVHPDGRPYLDESVESAEPVHRPGAPTDAAPDTAPDPAASDLGPASDAAPFKGVPAPRTTGEPAPTPEQLEQLRKLIEGGAA